MRSALKLLVVALAVSAGVVRAAEGEQLLELKNTIVNLVDALVEQGVITKEKAEAIKQEAALKASRDAAGAKATTEASPAAGEATVAGKQVVRVPYVPEFVKEEIREQVRAELRKDVRDDVVQIAREEKWGVKDALPKWVNQLEVHGDVRFRAEAEEYSDDNPDFINIAAGINDSNLQDLSQALLVNFAADPQALNTKGFLDIGNPANNLDVARNLSEERSRYPVRARINAKLNIDEHLTAGMRLTTGNIRNPVSINQTLGNDGRRFDVQLDQLYLSWDWLPFKQGPVISTSVGRYERPWLPQYTELLWDNDLQFEGASITLTQGFGRRSNPYKPERAVFLTGGAFPVGEVSFSTQDRYMLGIQGGTRWKFNDKVKASLGLGYFDYRNIEGRLNPVQVNPANPNCIDSIREPCFIESNIYGYTVPGFMQGGNTLFNIRADQDVFDDQVPYGLGLASDFNILNLTGQVDFSFFNPYHLIIDFDVAKNLGYDEAEILDRVTLNPAVRRPGDSGTALFNSGLTGCTFGDCLKNRTMAYAAMVRFGYPDVARRWQWQVMAQYRYLERDSVVDAYTESNFHQGGTDTEGFMLAGFLGVANETWLRLRYMSSDEIDDITGTDRNTNEFVSDGVPYGVDRLQLDLNARF